MMVLYVLFPLVLILEGIIFGIKYHQMFIVFNWLAVGLLVIFDLLDTFTLLGDDLFERTHWFLVHIIL